MKEKEERYMFNEFKKTFAQAFGVITGYAVAVTAVAVVYPYVRDFVEGDKQEEEETQKTKAN